MYARSLFFAALAGAAVIGSNAPEASALVCAIGQHGTPARFETLAALPQSLLDQGFTEVPCGATTLPVTSQTAPSVTVQQPLFGSYPGFGTYGDGSGGLTINERLLRDMGRARERGGHDDDDGLLGDLLDQRE